MLKRFFFVRDGAEWMVQAEISASRTQEREVPVFRYDDFSFDFGSRQPRFKRRRQTHTITVYDSQVVCNQIIAAERNDIAVQPEQSIALWPEFLAKLADVNIEHVERAQC